MAYKEVVLLNWRVLIEHKEDAMISEKTTITILIADDHPLTLKGVCSIFNHCPDMKVVGRTEDGDQIKYLVSKLHPKILLLDLKMPHLSPVELEEWVQTNCPETITLVLTAHDRDVYLSSMMEAGAVGYLDKKLRASELISAVRRAAHGEILFNKEQIKRARQWREEVKTKWENLSDRERDVLQMLTEGADNKAISGALQISINTVEKHLKNIYQKLEVDSRYNAIIWWIEKGTDFRT